MARISIRANREEDNVMTKYDRYLKITTWARKRYIRNYCVVLWIGNIETTYTKIERMAWDKYLA